MKSENIEELFNAHLKQGKQAFVQLKVWRTIETNAEHHTHLRYRLALIDGGVCVLHFNNVPNKKGNQDRLKTAANSIHDIPALLREFWQRVDDYHHGEKQ
ncbi:hypothetical protein CKO09_10235 [Chromatium weissei]|nr:hypothetical protein [Chromatium weissei]